MPLNQAQLFDDVRDALQLDEYQDFTAMSDRSGLAGADGLGFVLLGLFGEVGSLLSALKKKKRDKDAFLAYDAAVVEEFGDALWYLANAAGRVGLKLSDLAGRVVASHADWSYHGRPVVHTFAHLQNTSNLAASSGTAFEHRLIELAAKTGGLLDSYASGRIDNNRDRLAADLVEVFRSLVRAADDADISLDIAARRNVAKSEGRWPRQKSWGGSFDEVFPVQEQFPRHMVFDFFERTENGNTFVVVELDGVNVGDRLTDNRSLQDDYRFHDVFHLAHAAVLGWSPTLRGMLRRKRKSNPQVDQNEDGARAILIEEGISSWIFNHAAHAMFYRSTTSLDFELLKSVREFVQGYEVEARPMWQWEIAILEGYRVFRLLKEHRGGRVTVDLDQHTLVFEPR
ncbi:nucleoside triphosphate pyrophosphohydrolase family protein [Variovorax sp. AFSI2.2]|uniref:nucleoside triphosphate pyrophosphohydrolase family protein n=1 Tax=Variovorax sp. AFSI2.2 TaxID=3384160 RepID=UPI003EBF884B